MLRRSISRAIVFVRLDKVKERARSTSYAGQDWVNPYLSEEIDG